MSERSDVPEERFVHYHAFDKIASIAVEVDHMMLLCISQQIHSKAPTCHFLLLKDIPRHLPLAPLDPHENACMHVMRDGSAS